MYGKLPELLNRAHPWLGLRSLADSLVCRLCLCFRLQITDRRNLQSSVLGKVAVMSGFSSLFTASCFSHWCRQLAQLVGSMLEKHLNASSLTMAIQV